MTKILLVEDDKSLSEIYSVRLRAEGYDILSASDGEQALALAIKEVPDLIISDVMMPNISGFDMLDILRSTTETRGIHVIMMTALSSDEQRQRGMALGADRYLVKSQVGIEDVVRTVHEVLGDASVPAETPAPLVNEPKRATIEPGPSARATEPAPDNNSPEKAESDNTKANELSPNPETPGGPASSSSLAANSTAPTPANPAPTDTAAATATTVPASTTAATPPTATQPAQPEAAASPVTPAPAPASAPASVSTIPHIMPGPAAVATPISNMTTSAGGALNDPSAQPALNTTPPAAPAIPSPNTSAPEPAAPSAAPDSSDEAGLKFEETAISSSQPK